MINMSVIPPLSTAQMSTPFSTPFTPLAPPATYPRHVFEPQLTPRHASDDPRPTATKAKTRKHVAVLTGSIAKTSDIFEFLSR